MNHALLGSHALPLVSACLFLACSGHVALRSAAGASTNARYATGSNGAAQNRLQAARSLAAREPGWRLAAKQKFPGDHWSQDDDFHNTEQHAIREIAVERNLPVAEVLRGIDELMRVEPAGRKTAASPCKPRPFYD